MDLLNQLNWTDILLIGIAARIVFIGIKRGIVVETFKLVGTFCTIFITLHYYSKIAVFLQEKIRLPREMGDVVSFIFLWVVAAIVFKLIRDGFLILLRVEAHSVIDRWGSMVVAVGRAVLVCSMMVLLLRLVGSEAITATTERSYLGSRVVNVAPSVYEASYEGFVGKFFPSEKLNGSIFAISTSGSDSKQAQTRSTR